MSELELPYHVRDRHIFIPGMTGYGKSTLMHCMAYQDIMNGVGVCVIDPKGDLVKELCQWIPKERVEDTVYLDLETPIPLDFMSCSNQDSKDVLVGDLKYIFTRGASTENAPLMNAILDDLIYTLLDANANPRIPPDRKATFIDIYDFLEDEARRKEILHFATDARLKRRWLNDFPNPKDRRPVITRMTPFVRSKSLSTILGTPNPKLNVGEFMNNRKVILVDLGGVSESKMIYGALLVSRIQQAAFARHSIAKEKRIPFFLYVDEFENFQTGSFHKIISQARGYKLCLTVGCQWLDQLNPEVKSAIFTVSTYIIFAVQEKDSKQFKALIRPYEPDDLVELKPYEALYIINKRRPIKKHTPPPPPDITSTGRISYAEEIKRKTLEKYGARSAESGLKRTIGAGDCKQEETIASSEHDDAIEPTTGPIEDIPSHGSENKSTS
jgi:hypothetical protein